MRQTTINQAFPSLALRSKRSKPTSSSTPKGVQILLDLVKEEGNLLWYAIVPFGNSVKCISELLMRCSTQTPLVVTSEGLVMVASDQTSGRLIRI